MQQTYYRTTSMCPQCLELVPGRVLARESKVYVERICPEHGEAVGLVSADVDWYERSRRFSIAPVRPRTAFTRREHGCPQDCGLCDKHLQIAGTATIEVSNKCNATCPICLADNKDTFEISADQVRGMLDELLTVQDQVETVTLSGGEPTIHPQFFEILDVLQHPAVGRVAINSNGIRICEDDAFLDRLVGYDKAYVGLHFDGTQARSVRGLTHEYQWKALARLCARGINVVPTVVGIKDVNDAELGRIVEGLLLHSPHIKTVLISLMTYTGGRGSHYPGDALRRLTIPEALAAVESGTNGRIARTHFMPVMMPNPQCTAIGYFLAQDGELTPLLPLVETEEVVRHTGGAAFGEIDASLEELLRSVVDRIYADPDRYQDAEALSRKLKALLAALFPPDHDLSDCERQRIAMERIKSIYVFQLMDCWTFDTQRLPRCFCVHLFPDRSIIPSCAFYAYHRRLD